MICIVHVCMIMHACVHLKMADLGHHHCLYSTSCTGTEVIFTHFYHRFPMFLNTDMHHQQTSAGETNWCGKVLESEFNHLAKMLRTCQFIHDHLPHAACLHHPIQDAGLQWISRQTCGDIRSISVATRFSQGNTLLRTTHRARTTIAFRKWWMLCGLQCSAQILPLPSMYGIFTYIYHRN